MKIYFESLAMHLKSELEYRVNFILSFLSQILVFFTYYFIILALFSKFDHIKGFTLYEVLLCFAIIQFGFAFNEVFARGIDKFDELIIRGDFDRLLLRPKNIILQVLCSDSDFVKVSRLIQSILVLIVAIFHLNISWNLLKIFTLLLMLLSSCVIFFGIFLMAASYCFFTVQGLEVRNVFTDGGKHMAQYPIGVFSKGFVWFFTFIIPYAFVNYYPLLFFLGRNSSIFYAFSPLLVLLYLIPSIATFYLGMKRYSSVGS
ncbi:MAG: ABC-2 family transporter protein [Bacilli bacterium]|nr:ABC-2 family transporter protein [Bacilli bacterium]